MYIWKFKTRQDSRYNAKGKNMEDWIIYTLIKVKKNNIIQEEKWKENTPLDNIWGGGGIMNFQFL